MLRLIGFVVRRLGWRARERRAYRMLAGALCQPRKPRVRSRGV